MSDSGKNKQLRSMFSDSVYVAFGSYATQFFSLLISVLLTRLLSAETYGVYGVLLSMFMLGTAFLSFGVTPIIERYLPELLAKGNRGGVRRLTYIALLAHLGAGVGLSLFCWFMRGWLGPLFKIDPDILLGVLPWFALFTIFKFETVVLEATLTAHRSQAFRNISLAAFQIFKWLLYFFFLPQDGSIGTVMSFLVISNFLLVIALLYRTFILTRRVPDLAEEDLPWRRIARFGALRYVNTLAVIGFLTYIDTLIISHFHGPEEAGLYAFATSQTAERLIALVPIYFLSQVLLPVYIKEYTLKGDKGQLIKVFRFFNKVVSTFMVPIVIGSVLLAEPIVMHVFDPKFLPAVTAFRIFMVASLIFHFCNTTGFLQIILERPEITLYGRIFIIYNIIMDFVLIPRYGIEGAAMATGSATVFGYVLSFWLVKRVIAIRVDWGAIARIFLYCVAMALPVWLLTPRIGGLMDLLGVILLGAAIYGLLSWRLPVFDRDERLRLNEALGRRVFPIHD